MEKVINFSYFWKKRLNWIEKSFASRHFFRQKSAEEIHSFPFIGIHRYFYLSVESQFWGQVHTVFWKSINQQIKQNDYRFDTKSSFLFFFDPFIFKVTKVLDYDADLEYLFFFLNFFCSNKFYVNWTISWKSAWLRCSIFYLGFSWQNWKLREMFDHQQFNFKCKLFCLDFTKRRIWKKKTEI